MKKCLNCGDNSEYILCDKCESVDKVEILCKKLIKYPYEPLDVLMDEISTELNNPSNIKLALYALADYFQGDKKIYYQIMSISKGTRIDKSCYPTFYKAAIPIIDSSDLTIEERAGIMALLLNTYQSDYKYEEAENLAKKLIQVGSTSWNTTYALGEYYTYTRRYDKAKEILETVLKSINTEEIKNIITEKLEDCINRHIGKKKEYLPATTEAKEKYKELLDSINIEITLPVKKAKNPNEIAEEDYPDAIETKNTNFNTFISFDLETTGFATYDAITEIGAVKVTNGEIVDRFTSLVNTRRKISNEITELTGITAEMLADAPIMEEVLPRFIEFIGDNVLLGHNVIRFDSRFILRAARKHGIIINNPFFDVMNYAKKIDHNKKIFNKYDLCTLCETLEISNSKAHRALSDAEATSKVYLELLKIEGKEKKNETIDDILDDMDNWL